MVTLVDSQSEITFSTLPDQDEIVVIAGRQLDVQGWLGNMPFTEVTGLNTWESISSRAVVGSEPDAAAASLRGNDMWLFERTGTGEVTMNSEELPQEAGLVLLAANLTTSTTPSLTLTWPRDVTAPYQWPLIGAGLATILLGGAIALTRSRQIESAVGEAVAAPSEPLPDWEPGIRISTDDADDTFWHAPELAEPAVVPTELPSEIPETAPELVIPEPSVSAEPLIPLPEVAEAEIGEHETGDHWATFRPSRPVWPPLPDLLAVLPDDEPQVEPEPEPTAEPVAESAVEPAPLAEPTAEPAVEPEPEPIPEPERLALPPEPVIEPVPFEPEPMPTAAPEPEEPSQIPVPPPVETPASSPTVVPTPVETPVPPKPAPQPAPEPKRAHRWGLRRNRRPVEPPALASQPAPAGPPPAPVTAPPVPPAVETPAVELPTAPPAPTPVPSVPTPVQAPASTPATGSTPSYTPPVSRSALREARRVAEETGDTQMLEALTGAIRQIPEPEAVTSHIPIQTADWRATWGLEGTSRRSRRAATGEFGQVQPDQANSEGDE